MSFWALKTQLGPFLIWKLRGSILVWKSTKLRVLETMAWTHPCLLPDWILSVTTRMPAVNARRSWHSVTVPPRRQSKKRKPGLTFIPSQLIVLSVSATRQPTPGVDSLPPVNTSMQGWSCDVCIFPGVTRLHGDSFLVLNTGLHVALVIAPKCLYVCERIGASPGLYLPVVHFCASFISLRHQLLLRGLGQVSQFRGGSGGSHGVPVMLAVGLAGYRLAGEATEASAQCLVLCFNRCPVSTTGCTWK